MSGGPNPSPPEYSLGLTRGSALNGSLALARSLVAWAGPTAAGRYYLARSGGSSLQAIATKSIGQQPNATRKGTTTQRSADQLAAVRQPDRRTPIPEILSTIRRAFDYPTVVLAPPAGKSPGQLRPLRRLRRKTPRAHNAPTHMQAPTQRATPRPRAVCYSTSRPLHSGAVVGRGAPLGVVAP